jgi:hypothetical protein
VDLNIHSPLRLHGVVLNYLSTGTTLLFLSLLVHCPLLIITFHIVKSAQLKASLKTINK